MGLWAWGSLGSYYPLPAGVSIAWPFFLAHASWKQFFYWLFTELLKIGKFSLRKVWSHLLRTPPLTASSCHYMHSPGISVETIFFIKVLYQMFETLTMVSLDHHNTVQDFFEENGNCSLHLLKRGYKVKGCFIRKDCLKNFQIQLECGGYFSSEGFMRTSICQECNRHTDSALRQG